LLAALCACSDSSTPSTPSNGSLVTAVVVTGTPPVVGATSQFTATAIRADHSTSTVTGEAIWRSSSSAATVDAKGLVTGITTGSADISATYANVPGSLTVAVQPGGLGTLSGIVAEKATNQPIPSATVTIGGTVTRTATTDALGRYSISGIPSGIITLRYTVTASGYITSADSQSLSFFNTSGASLTRNFSLDRPTSCPAIGFDELQTNGVQYGQPFDVYSACGFTVRAMTPNWVAFILGRPAPSIGNPGNMTTESVQVSAAGRTFTFQSVELYSSVTPIPYAISGIRNNATVFVMQATVPNTFGNFATVQNPQPTVLIDSLVIELTNPLSGNPMGMDNIRVLP